MNAREAAVADLMAVLEEAHSTDFGSVQIPSEHSTDFWAALNSVKAAPAVVQAEESEWQPIATAPKDGREVLLYLGSPWSEVEKAYWFPAWENWQRGADMPDADKDEYCGIGSDIPTHWMPLPAAPKVSP